MNFALKIPTALKIYDGVKKWILHKALLGKLPKNVLMRTKSKFWQGAEVSKALAYYADTHIADGEFTQERYLPNNWVLRSKEELLYYRIFQNHFGDLPVLSWMGRTTSPPN